jgi:UDP-N-acetylglucosamine transferase subunit ALG13
VIFVTVGTQLPFDRLIRGVDAWAARNPGIRVHAQTGHVPPDGYHPRHMHSSPMLDPETFGRLFRSARLVVAHAGTGSLLQFNAYGTPILVMPRKAALGEHRNDHQMATARHFGTRNGVHVVYEEEDLGPTIDALLSGAPQVPDLRTSADPELIATLRRVIFASG